MPEDSEDASSVSLEQRLERRLAASEAERLRLQGELDAIANRATDRWLSAAQFESKALAAIQQTVSWRVTKPLRAVRSLPAVRARARRS